MTEHIVNGAPYCGQQGPGPYTTGQDPGPPPQPQPQIPPQPRPFFYAHAAPPPPFLYQWPMPFPYNPFAGFPGMGFMPPNPYMAAPGYMLPHPPLQPVAYRRLPHPRVPAASASYQSQNQNPRFRPQQNVSVVRETVSSEVQTEPILTKNVAGNGEGSPLASSESGLANPTSSSSSTTGKQGYTEVDNYTLPSSNAKESVGQENGAPCSQGGLGHCEMWSVCSTDGLVPVCSSSDHREDDVAKERRVSFPDVLSWVGGSAPVEMFNMIDKVFPQSEVLLVCEEAECEMVVNHSSSTESGKVVDDGNDTEDVKSESVGLVGSIGPFIPSRESLVTLLASVNQAQKVSDNDPQKVSDNDPQQRNVTDSGLQEETTEITPPQMSFTFVQMKRARNDSVWSVESLPPYVPSKEWLMQNDVLEPDVITDKIIEEGQNGALSTQNDNLIVKANKRGLSSAEPLPAYVPSDSWFGDLCKVYCHDRLPLTSQQSSPAEKLRPRESPEMECEIDSSKIEGQLKRGIAPSEKDTPASPTHLQSKVISSPPSVDDVGSSESEVLPYREWMVKLLVSVNQAQKVSDNDPQQGNVNDSGLQETTEIIPPQMSFSSVQMKTARNDSVWSVESLPPYVPSTEWLIQNGILEPDVIFDECKVILSPPSVEENNVDGNGSSEPEAYQSPNQESLDIIKQQEKSPCSSEQVENCLSNSVEGEENQVIGQLSLHNKLEMEQKQASLLRSQQLGVEMGDQTIAVVSPSKGHVVDCGVQCSELQAFCLNCLNQGFRGNTGVTRKNPKRSKKANKAKAVEETCENGHVQKTPKRHGQWKHKLQDRQLIPANPPFTQCISQEESNNGYYDKPGKTKGGNGRTRY